MPSLAANISVAPETFSPFVPGYESNYLFGLCLTLSLGLVLLSRVSLISREPSYPIVTLERDVNDSNTAEEEFRLRGNEILEKGRAEYPGQPFWVHSDDGDLLILPGRLANDMRNVDELSFMEALKERLHASLPGFEPFQASSRGDQLVQVVTRKQLTKALNKVTRPLSDETAYAVDLRFGRSSEWKEHHLYTEILDIVARISARVFLGEQVCRNQDWLDITKSYTVQCFKAASALRQKPPSLRSLLHWFDPSCRKVRSYVTKARQIIAPVIRRRQELRREALARGDPLPTLNDAIDWFEEEAGGKPYDPEIVQLTLSMLAIHTTTDLLAETMTNIALNPELFTQLREEISRVLKAEGWVKTSLYNLKLLDSVVKESQRLKPLNSVSQLRKVTSSITLPDGTLLPKGIRVACDAGLRLSDAYYPDPLRFDGGRHLAWRSMPDKKTSAHLVSTSPESMGFGHGQHSCPGRFFAANEIKVALCHLLMKYDWKLSDGCKPRVQKKGLVLSTDPKTKIMVRRREQVELDIDDLGTTGH